MSPPPTPPSFDHEQTQAIVKDGLVASILGGLAMTARLLLSTEPVSPGWVFRRIMAAAITAAAGFTFAIWYYSVGLEIYILPLALLTPRA